jgi:xanthine/uracil permease
VPAVGRYVTAMPPPVLGALALLLFGLVAVSGLRLISRAGLSHRNALLVSLSLGFGLGAPTQPQLFAALPAALRSLFDSGIAVGGLTAVLLNLALPRAPAAPAAAELE